MAGKEEQTVLNGRGQRNYDQYCDILYTLRVFRENLL